MLSSNSFFRSPSSYTLADIFIIEALTHLHVGSGKTGGAIDLPVQRDENGYPCIYASSLKGALKTSLLYGAIKMGHSKDEALDLVRALLGSEPGDEESFQSSVAILDAYLLAMPARSLKGVYAYVTTPTLLRKFKQYLDLYSAIHFGTSKDASASPSQNVASNSQPPLSQISDTLETLIEEADNLSENQYMCLQYNNHNNLCEKVQIQDMNNKIVLVEDMVLDPYQSKTNLDANNLKNLYDNLSITEKPLIVLNDTTGKEVIDRSILVLAHVSLDENKTVDNGPWTTEYIPSKTRFLSMALYKKPQISKAMLKKYSSQSSNLTEETYKEVLQKLLPNIQETANYAEMTKNTFQSLIEELQNYIIIGGRETVGKGIVRLNFTKYGGEAQ
jgi:CRISPR-associated protein Cmr4